MTKRNYLALLLAIVMLTSVLFSGCGNAKSNTDVPADVKEPQATNDIVPEVVMVDDNTVNGTAKVADKMSYALIAPFFSVAPFSVPSPANMLGRCLWATLFTTPYYGAPLEELEPYIGKSIERVGEGVYEIELFDYVTDSQGNPITADDIIFSYEKSATDAQLVDVSSYIEKLEKVDDYHLTMILNYDAPNEICSLTTNAQLYICDKDWYECTSEDERQKNPATTGPYMVKEVIPGSSATIVRNKNFWQTDLSMLSSAARANIEEIEFRVIAESSMRAIALENKEIDVAQIGASDLSHFFQNGESLPGYLTDMIMPPRGNMALLNLSAGNSPFADNLDLRKAALYALNSEDIMLASGNTEYTGKVMYDIATDLCYGYNDDWETQDYFNYDPAKASEFYTSAGYKPGEVKLTLLTNTALCNDATRSVIIAELEEVGFKVESLAVDQALFNTYKNDPTQWDIIYDVKESSTGHIASLYDYCFNPNNYELGSVCCVKDDDLVALIEQLNNTGDSADADKVHKYLIDNAMGKGLFTGAFIYVAQDGITKLPMNGTAMCYNVNGIEFSEDYQSNSK